MQSEYKWKIWSETGLPSSIDDTYTNLPNDEQFERTKCVHFTEDALEGGAKIAFQLPFLKIEDLHTYERMEDLHIYEQVAISRGRPEVRVHNAARWTTDVEFGRQMLNGVNPVVIERCTKLPDNFPVTNEMVKGVLNRGLTLQQEMDVCCNNSVICKTILKITLKTILKKSIKNQDSIWKQCYVL